MTDAATHRVFNQVPDLAHYNLFDSDPTVRAALERLGGGWHADTLRQFGARLGEPEVQQWAADANRHAPELHTHSRTGERIDTVEFHPGWHALLGLLREQQLQALPFAQPRAGAWAARTAGYYLQAQVESGSLCPPTMTFASIPVLRKEAALFAELEPRLYAAEHDARDLPWRDKAAIMIGMGMTEKQGGSDVRANTTVARPVRGEGRGAEYALTGHKWFFSAPMCDAHLVVARMGAEDGPLSCFFVPRFRDDGSRNAVQIQRLKDKLGNRSNASSEVEFRDATGILVGEEGRGIPTIIEMATNTRLDCVIGSSAILRAAFVQALHHTRHRSAFGRLLCDQPLMRNVLADLALESEAATLLMMELGHAFAQAEGDNPDPLAAAWKRVVTPAAKFWVCKRTLEATGEAMEVWGGNGYVEEGPMARLYREAPVNSIWEGSGNIMCLDVLRALQRNPDDGARLLQDLSRRAGGHPAVRAELASLQAMLRENPDQLEASARRFAQSLVLTAQAALMLAHAEPAHAELFVASRLGRQHGRVFGTLDADAGALGRVALRGFEG
ncbi:isovaleryl CoA dehydrogenase [Cupriavidus taiwanensis]|uniref:Isovaleryl CoA dehydrogenase n=1 Tax=Cupriavidus taiwanensis TaxID=164546 RepID=A0A375E3W1_9BURK|nr:acyl-CoA dehydrogenase family protein [Cupriavidus taiwanensis]SOZ59324.1 isovaleryl CoA dehydrogenase [Cupriavidus taiwanensis]SOZ59944.1 isovaleryl CoA dehydrogenase [Cupriavidus taiwanensis]SOZ63010.1 isovaleryl CoA dehydrogenase [Cupriavidus taiwanensis]SPA06416.1 isovaleryl CoA dehydrogenase [Cupriavidus taiwanensis]